ncbi:hypothetical protein EXS54_02050 [Patescibacteria group bacterium]|nr:hypothetical protein [Patescibacteria group bacterium]
MKTVYVQHLLKVLLEEYEDIDYMLDTLQSEKPSSKEAARIRRLLNELGQQNKKLQTRFDA